MLLDSAMNDTPVSAENTTDYLDCSGWGGAVAGRETKPPAPGSFVATTVSGRPLVKEPAWKALWVHRIPWSL